MKDFESMVDQVSANVVAKLVRWDKEKSAKELHREYLSEEGLNVKGKSKLQELQDARHKIALEAEDPELQLKAIESSIAMAAGSEKITLNNNTQNNFSFGELLKQIKSEENGQ